MEKNRGYHKRLLAETAIFRYKQLPNPKLTLSDYSTQVGVALVNMQAMNKVLRLGIPIRQ
ncbi:hypothetical protein [Candidatus Enterovibrio escicola]|uniref:Mobile element protein n=1 Tax=Candidatus Enterovibrio escicola TaxID=1927127 RepID=A0A2A5T0B1_9GAMM|nr:Mobile element protein [Candidatus Enterovibrio escacola]